MTHRDRAVTSATAHALGSCSAVDLVFCECGAFRLNERWVEPTSLPTTDDDLTLTQAATSLRV
jgi:hypothetical protein